MATSEKTPPDLFYVNEYIECQARVVVLLADWFVWQDILADKLASLFGKRPRSSARENKQRHCAISWICTIAFVLKMDMKYDIFL
jgi:hypothetical protein